MGAGSVRQISFGSLVALGVFCFVVSLSVIVLTTPLHESIHFVISEYMDPYVEVVEFHPFGVPETVSHHRLPSLLGCVVIQEAYPGAFFERPGWFDPVQEMLCILVQVLIACFVTLRMLAYISKIKESAISC